MSWRLGSGSAVAAAAVAAGAMAIAAAAGAVTAAAASVPNAYCSLPPGPANRDWGFHAGVPTLTATYNGVHKDAVQFAFPRACRDHDHYYTGSGVVAEVPR